MYCVLPNTGFYKKVDFYSNIMSNVVLGNIFTRQLHNNEGTAINVQNNLRFKKVDLYKFCKEFTLELGAIKLDHPLDLIID